MNRAGNSVLWWRGVGKGEGRYQELLIDRVDFDLESRSLEHLEGSGGQWGSIDS